MVHTTNLIRFWNGVSKFEVIFYIGVSKIQMRNEGFLVVDYDMVPLMYFRVNIERNEM